MGAYVLIIIIMNNHGNFVTSVPFETKKACENATAAISGAVSTVCSATGLNEELDNYLKEQGLTTPPACGNNKPK